eukprot:s108_g27.t3
MQIGALMKAVLVLSLLHSSPVCFGQEDLPAWLFKATLVDTLHLPPGAQGSDLLADTTFREFVRNLFSGAMVLPMIHIPPSAFVLENATVLEDVYAEAINAHGGVGQGKKSVRFEAVLTVASRAVAMEIWRMPMLSLAGLAPWRKLRIQAITDMSIYQLQPNAERALRSILEQVFIAKRVRQLVVSASVPVPLSAGYALARHRNVRGRQKCRDGLENFLKTSWSLQRSLCLFVPGVKTCVKTNLLLLQQPAVIF